MLTAGGSYTLTSVTSVGTASASLSMPNYAVLASDGSSASWTGPAMFSVGVVVNNGGSTTYNSGFCWSAQSPLSVPSSAYPVSGTYVFGVERINYTTAITGGTGMFDVYNIVQNYVTK